jgi:dTDP-4-amino-4,6-dideoxygalactose transaminase
MSEYSESVQFIDLKAQQELIRQKLDTAIANVLDHGQYIMGPEVKSFESDLREFTGAKYALTCANGTDAISLVLMAWDIGPGDAVFVPSFTYVASAEAPAQLGAIPFFVDVCEHSFNIDPISLKQAIADCRKTGLKPRVVVVVDLFGQPADIDSIADIARSEGIKILVDGAQSFGGTSKGRPVGSLGDATTTSFFPAKPLGCYGDGGAIFTSCDEDSEIINSLRLHGKGSQKYDNVRIGINSRLDTLQAAILIEKLKLFPRELALRAEVAQRYNSLLQDQCQVPILDKDHTSAWAQYTLVLPDRDKIQSALKASSVPSVVYYPIPLSNQTGYKQYPKVSSGTLTSERLSRQVLSLPMHPYLEFLNQQKIADLLVSNLSMM